MSYVTADHHRYVTNIQRREEAGTPGILEATNYVISAVEFLARYAPILMKLYSVDEHNGVWHACSQRVSTRPANLLDTLLSQGAGHEQALLADAEDYFARAEQLVEQARALPLAVTTRSPNVPVRWFWWPHEAEQALQAQIEITQ